MNIAIKEDAPLLESTLDCANAVGHALNLLRQNAPRVQDYLLTMRGDNLPGPAYVEALRQHNERVEKIESVLSDLLAIAKAEA